MQIRQQPDYLPTAAEIAAAAAAIRREWSARQEISRRACGRPTPARTRQYKLHVRDQTVEEMTCPLD